MSRATVYLARDIRGGREVRADWIARAALLAAGLAAGVLLAEIGLRLAGVSFPLFSHPDPDRGWALRPGARGYYDVEGGTWVEVNRDGWRDRERPRHKPPGTRRVAVLGDSYAEALGIPAESTFWHRLERALDRSVEGGRRVEAMNFGVHGYGTLQELLTLRCCVRAYAPDLVLLAFFAGNDLSDNFPPLDRSPTRYARPYATIDSSGLAVDRSFQTSWRYRAGRLLAPLVAHSRVLQLANRGHNLYARGMNHVIGLDTWVFEPHPTGLQADAWRITEELIAAMARETARQGAEFAMVIIPMPMQVHPDSATREQLARELDLNDFSLPARRLAELGRKSGFRVLDLAPALQGHADSTGAFVHGSGKARPGTGHWNLIGHRVAGDAIARWIGKWWPTGK